jgi:hypothetical protein
MIGADLSLAALASLYDLGRSVSSRRHLFDREPSQDARGVDPLAKFDI